MIMKKLTKGDQILLMSSLSKAIEGLHRVRDTSHYCDCHECGGFYEANETIGELDLDSINQLICNTDQHEKTNNI